MLLKTMICLIMDRSGSMQSLRQDVIGGVNSFIEQQKKQPEPATMAFVRFDSPSIGTPNIERFRPMQPLAEVKPLALEEYEPRGWTPLLDAVGKTIVDLDEDWKREQPDRAIVVIVTDGQENASKEYLKPKIKSLIQAREASGKWTFIFLGANVDAFAEASSLGIRSANTAGYTASAAGLGATYSTISETVGSMRRSGATTAHNLGGTIAEDGTLKSGPIDSVVPLTTDRPDTWVPPVQTDPDLWTPPPAA